MQYHFSVRDNVALDEDDPIGITAALDLAGATSAVDGLSHGVETQLGRDFENGAELSIGQWQRLALARAFYRDAPLLILDEPASALDPTAEVELVNRLRTVCQGRCVVMVSHRFASVRQADVIFVLDEGRVIEQGSHEQLLAIGGAYSALYRSQADHFAD